MKKEKKYNVRHNTAGFESLLSPMAGTTSSSRSAMFSGHAKQAIPISGLQIPLVSSGFEKKFAKLEFDPTGRTSDVSLIGTICKPYTNVGSGLMAEYIVIYRDSDHQVKYFELNNYTILGKEFGYKNKLNEGVSRIIGGTEGTFIPKDTKLISSPAVINGMYCMGTNMNVIYTSNEEVGNDAFIISRSKADELESVGVYTIVIHLKKNQIPLNIYGKNGEYRSMPHIGHNVENNILFAFRNESEHTFGCDMTEAALSKINLLHDTKYPMEDENATVIDIKCIINQSEIKKISADPKYRQFLDIHDSYVKYYTEIIDMYKYVSSSKLEISPEFNSLVVHAMGMLPKKNNGKMKLLYKDTPVDFMTLEITCVFPRAVDLGSKITDRQGSKGVISAIWDDINMPITESGIRADCIISDKSPFNRLNGGQWHEQFYTYVSSIERKRVLNILNSDPNPNYEMLFERVLNLYEGISTDSYIEISKLCITPELKKQFLEELRNYEFYFCVPPFSTDVHPRQYKLLSEKFNIKKENWSYISPHTGKTIYSKFPTIIGSKYMLLLGKLPSNSISAIQIGYSSQVGLATKPIPKQKAYHTINVTPIRLGVDELSLLNMAVESETVARLMLISNNCMDALKMLQHRLSTDPNPSQLFRIDMSTEEMLNRATNITLFNHMFSCIGVEFEKGDKRVSQPLNLVPGNITKQKIKKVLRPIGDSPYVVEIIYNGSKVDIASLKQFKFVDSVMQNENYTGRVEIKFSDGSIALLNPRLAILNFILWDIFLYFYIIPSKNDLFDIKNIKSSLFKNIYTKIYYRLFDEIEYMYVLERIWTNINYINRWNSLYLEAYNSTLCGLDMSEILEHPKMIDILSRRPSSNDSIKFSENRIKELTNEFIEAIKTGEIPSELKKFIETDSLKLDQVGQFIIAIGTKDDINGKIFRHVISGSSFEGFQCVEDYATEALSAAKSQFYNTSSIQTAGVFQKHLRTIEEQIKTVYDNHCGNTDLVPLILKPNWLPGFIDRIVYDNGKYVKLTEDNIREYSNKDILLVDPLYCYHTDGVCSNCAGYGDIGVLKKFIFPGTLLGVLSSTKLAKDIMQKILSNKHLSKTNSIIYTLPETASMYMEKSSKEGIVFRKDIQSTIKSMYLYIPMDSFTTTISDVFHEIKMLDTFTIIDGLKLVTENGDEKSFSVKCGSNNPFLSKQFLAYIKKIYKKLTYTDKDVIIPLDEFDMGSAVLRYNTKNQDMREYVNSVKQFFDSKIADYKSATDLLTAAFDLIYEKSTVSSFHISIVLKAFVVEKYKKGDDIKLKLDSAERVLNGRDTASKLRHKRLTNWFSNVDTYIKPKKSSMADVYFNF